MSNLPDNPGHDLERRLREAMQHKRPRNIVRFLLACCLIAGLFGLAAWWYAWRGFTPPLGVIGFDHVALPGQALTLRAATTPVEGGEERWGGQFLYFAEVMAIGVQ